MEWHNFETYQPPAPVNRDYTNFLCKVTGVPFLEYAVFRYDGKIWWSYLPPGLFDNFAGGWVGLPRGAKITHWAFIDPD